MSDKIALITLGQAPRTDITKDIRALVGDCATFIEAGALDPLSDREIAQLLEEDFSGGEPAGGTRPMYTAEVMDGSVRYVSRLRSGRVVALSEPALLPYLQRCLEQVRRQGAKFSGLLCTGEFRPLSSASDLIRPYVLLHEAAAANWPGGHVGVVVPHPSQVSLKHREWTGDGFSCSVDWAPAYDDVSKVLSAAERLTRMGVDVIVLDCMGFPASARQAIEQALPCPVLLPRDLLARRLREMLGSGDPNRSRTLT